MAIELDPNERWALLDRHMVMRLATVDPSGRPRICPIWYVADRDYGRIYFSTPEDTRKVRDIEHEPFVSVTIDEGAYYFELRAVIAEGPASIVADATERADIETQWCEKYFDSSSRPEFLDLLYQGRPWEWYAIDPERWVSWDNDKIDMDRIREIRTTE